MTLTGVGALSFFHPALNWAGCFCRLPDLPIYRSSRPAGVFCGSLILAKLLRPYLHPAQPPIDRISIKRLGIKIPSDPLDRARVIRVSFVA